jgi:hypothetical protein
MRTAIAIVAMLMSAGCAPYTRVQIGLVEQARRGVAMWQQREAERDAAAKAEFDRRRAEMGRAFDEDVRDRAPGEISPDWVIEARKAYAAGLDVIARAESAVISANETARRNADATDQALQKLLWLESIELDMGSIADVGNIFERKERP